MHRCLLLHWWYLARGKQFQVTELWFAKCSELTHTPALRWMERPSEPSLREWLGRKSWDEHGVPTCPKYFLLCMLVTIIGNIGGWCEQWLLIGQWVRFHSLPQFSVCTKGHHNIYWKKKNQIHKQTTAPNIQIPFLIFHFNLGEQ